MIQLERPKLQWRKYNKQLLRQYPSRAFLPQALVSISHQRIYLLHKRNLLAVYPVSTSRFGTGNIQGSYRTPLGVHCVAAKIGDGKPIMTPFVGRQAGRQLAAVNPLPSNSKEDVITTRILWLSGLQSRINQGGYVDSARRTIYIHGTINENRIGIPSSVGCIRMKNKNVCLVFATLAIDSLVYIIK